MDRPYFYIRAILFLFQVLMQHMGVCYHLLRTLHVSMPFNQQQKSLVTFKTCILFLYLFIFTKKKKKKK